MLNCLTLQAHDFAVPEKVVQTVKRLVVDDTADCITETAVLKEVRKTTTRKSFP